MLINNSRLVGCPVLSLHVGGPIARVVEPIIDPNTLKIIACEVEGPLVGREIGEILPMDSIREFSRLGMIVDSGDEFVERDEIIRVREVLDLNFSLIGLKVETERKIKLGKVSAYTIDPESWRIQQLIVQRPALKALLDPELIISHQQILEINDYKVIVKDQTAKVKAEAKNTTPVTNFINPFREPEFAPDTAQTSKTV